MIKNLLILFGMIIMMIPFVVGYAETREECINGGGNWVKKIYCDTIEEKLNPDRCSEYYCRCSEGFIWKSVEHKCIEYTDEMRCDASDGKWNGNGCICPEHSVGWIEGFGCDYAAVPLLPASSKQTNYTTIIIVVVVAIVLFTIFNKRRNLK